MVSTGLFGVGLCCSIGAIFTAFTGKIRLTTLFSLATIVFMVLTRDLIRVQLLQPYFTLKSLHVAPQYDILVLFLAILIIGLALVAYMIRIGFRKNSGEAQS
jgi:hypothetical protein